MGQFGQERVLLSLRLHRLGGELAGLRKARLLLPSTDTGGVQVSVDESGSTPRKGRFIVMSVQLRSRDKLVIGAALGILSLAAWLSTVYQAQAMNIGVAPEQMNVDGVHEQMSMGDTAGQMTMGGAHEPMSSGRQSAFSLLPFLLFLSSWVVMMTAMMLPSTAPMVMTYTAISQQHRSGSRAYGTTGLFVLGYLLAWGGLGLLAYAVYAALPLIAMALPGLESQAGLLGGVVLILAGAYQLSSFKDFCLTHCRTPLGFIMTHWRDGQGGALHMGLQHGLYCIGCCWALMAIMFVMGLMNLAGMMLLALLMFVEKVSRYGTAVGKLAGILLIISGTAMAFYSIL